MKIHQKLIIGYLIVTLMVGVVGYLGILTTGLAKEGYNEAAHHTIPAINVLSNLKFAGLRIVSSTIEFSFLRTEKQVSDKNIEQAEKEVERLIDQEIALYNKALKQYEDLVNRFSPEHYEHLQRIRNLCLRIQETSKELINLKRQGKLESGFIEKKEAFEKDEKAFFDTIDFIISKEQKDLVNKKNQIESSLEANTNMIILGILISAIAGILIGTFISHSISNPISKLRDAAGEIGRRNLDIRTDIKSKNEIGQLADSFNKMAEDLKKYHNHLEALVEERTAGLRDANEHLKQQINGRKRAEQALRIKDRAIESSISAIAFSEFGGNLTYVNKSFLDLWGYNGEQEILGRPATEFWEMPEKAIGVIELLQDKGNWRGELVTRRKDGSLFNIQVSASMVTDEAGKPWYMLGSFLDVTAQKQAEEKTEKLTAQLKTAQKMEAIGTLAGGIAHNFNNLLMGIQGNTYLMFLDIDSSHPHYKRLKSIEKQIQSGIKLTSQLLCYVSKGKYEVKPISLNQIVNEISDIFGQTRREIVIHKKLAEDLFAIEADQDQIEQVLLNLFVNAADAMPGGGDLFLETINITHKDIKSELYDPKVGTYAMLIVKDTGMGMDKSTVEQIFDPFFTTKEMGRGTGLGLASVYGIIKAHGGYIDVESRMKHGATFTIYLPATKSNILEVAKTSDKFIKGTGTVLVVDDEEIIQVLCKELLENIGYRVFTAKDGKEAIKLYIKNQNKIDIVVLDMIMPNMSGGEVYDRMKEINPDIKVLLSSGYSMVGEVTSILNRGCDGFIQKPFNINVLSAKIREILEKKKLGN
ncbi:MAG: response regulator [Desulfobacterales bacterium]|nr:response regulator [Desulfobacterales bacterium]